MATEALRRGRAVLESAAQAIRATADQLDASFDGAVERIFACKGRVVVTGLGKSGLVGRKVAATFASTGTPSLFMHPTEALHGDLGMIQPDDLVLVLCNSGETEEVLNLVRVLRKGDESLQILSLVGRADSTLARDSDVAMLIPPLEEGCPIGKAPMASTTVMIAMGDALAAALMERRGFRDEQYRRYHPGGNLGKRLGTTVRDLMVPLDRVPLVGRRDSVKAMIEAMIRRNVGAALVVADDHLEGIFTDGDVKRFLIDDEGASRDLPSRKVEEVMTSNPMRVDADQRAEEALHLMEGSRQITVMPVVSEGEVLGLIRLHDIIQAKIR